MSEGTEREAQARGLDGVGYAIGILAIAAACLRLRYGVDFVDEAWYVSVIRQFDLGGRLFVDEFRPQQISSWIFVPFYRLWTLLRSDSEGSVLFVRFLYLGTAAVASSCAYVFLSRFLRSSLAFAASTIFLLDVFYIPSVSYNTVGRWTLASGVFLLGSRMLAPGFDAWESALAGAFLAIASITYPPLALAAIAVFVALLLLPASAPARASLRVAGGSAVALGALFFALVLLPRWEEVLVSLEINSYLGIHQFSLAKLVWVVGNVSVWLVYPALGAIAAWLGGRRGGERGRVLAAVGAFVVASVWVETTHPDRIAPFTSIVAIGSLGTLLLWRARESRTLLFALAGTFLLAGLSTGFSSANGFLNFAVGASPASVLCLLPLLVRLEEGKGGRWATLSLVAFVAALFAWNSFHSVYGQGPILGAFRHVPSSELGYEVESGPYRGLVTTEERKSVAEALVKDFRHPVLEGRKTLLSYFDFPAAMLYGDFRSATYSTWAMRIRFFESHEAHLRRRSLPPEQRDLPEVVLKWKPAANFSNTYDPSPANDPVAPVFYTPRQGYETVVDNVAYSIIVRKK
jgi:hypothetical protein